MFFPGTWKDSGRNIYCSCSPGAICWLNNPPHPKAAIVLINWLLSQEGQTSYVRGGGYPSARLDVETKGILPEILPIPNEKVFTENEEMILASGRLGEIAREVLVPLIK